VTPPRQDARLILRGGDRGDADEEDALGVLVGVGEDDPEVTVDLGEEGVASLHG
jgi:hypothetical protein